ncbi:hypothetical protein V8F20_000702 [Naviculisporaceae sp. PSN 640]
MRFTTVLLTGALAAFASAQTTTASADPAVTSQQAAIAKCLAACEDGDVSCTSKCIAVPNPDEAQVNETNKCVAACPKGKGSEEDNSKYAACVEGCIGKYYFTATGTPALPTAGAGSGSGSGSGTGGTGSGSGNDSGSDSGSGSGGNNDGSDGGNGNGNSEEGAATDANGSPTGTGAPAQKTDGSGASGLIASGVLALVMGVLAL